MSLGVISPIHRTLRFDDQQPACATTKMFNKQNPYHEPAVDRNQPEGMSYHDTSILLSVQWSERPGEISFDPYPERISRCSAERRGCDIQTTGADEQELYVTLELHVVLHQNLKGKLREHPRISRILRCSPDTNLCLLQS
ncbi:hypothetical protein RF11_03832 [Thelohanellus kitauei]|uniref:Uncharacterized protein n=1 Tax=Thelohanellus kitauei TaxID=669202 RepID=A0A0C2JHY0_THEKT|nr:hypothetical protein RF11_03832 [Thelohanellus kitauei]